MADVGVGLVGQLCPGLAVLSWVGERGEGLWAFWEEERFTCVQRTNREWLLIN